MKQGLPRLLYNFGKRFMGWTLHMIMCVLCYPLSIHMSQQLSTGRPISSSGQLLPNRYQAPFYAQNQTLRVRNVKFATSKTLVNSLKKMMLSLKLGIFQFKKP